MRLPILRGEDLLIAEFWRIGGNGHKNTNGTGIVRNTVVRIIIYHNDYTSFFLSIFSILVIFTVVILNNSSQFNISSKFLYP